MSGLDKKGTNFPNGIAVAGEPLATTVLNATAIINPASIASAAQATATVTVPGAKLGDIVLGSTDADLQGIGPHFYVSSANTVTIVLKNGTAGAVDLPSSTWKIKVLRG